MRRGCHLYLLANLAYVVVLPLQTIQNVQANRVGTAAMQAIGDAGKIIMAIAIMISTSAATTPDFAGARVYYAMACDNLFFKRVGTLNAKHVPAVA
jgi:APA family basic amino acid/polyamine antiporter